MKFFRRTSCPRDFRMDQGLAKAVYILLTFMQVFLVSLVVLKDSNRCLPALITTLIGRLLILAKFHFRARL